MKKIVSYSLLFSIKKKILLMSDEGTYFNPKLLKDTSGDQYSDKKHRHKHRKHHRKIEETPVWDIWTIVPLVLAACLIILSSLLIYQKSHPIPFCSVDKEYSECFPCPPNGICSNGKLHCNKGFILSGRSCVADTEAELKSIRLANKIGKYIASQPNKNCNQSIGIRYEEILTNFRNELFFNEALDRIASTIYDIHIINNLYISYNPILDPKCQVYTFAMKNKESLVLLGVSVVLILTLYFSIKSKIRTKRLIKENAENIIKRLKEANGKKIYIDEFEPLKNEEMYKHWEEIIDEVEDCEAISVFNTEKGKAWKYSP